MFRISATTMLFATLSLVGTSSAGIILYDGSLGEARSNWESDVGIFSTENFSDVTLFPGVSVTTDNGSIAGGVWDDQMTTTASTTWSFDTPVSAFGADFNLVIPGGVGGGVTMAVIYADTTTETVGNIPITHGVLNDFYGFTSDVAVSQVVLTNTSATPERFEMDDMSFQSIAAVPEPSVFGLLGLLGMSAGGLRRRRQS